MTLILGKAIASAKQMSTYLLSVNKSPKFSRSISVEEFCQLYLDISAQEGVRGDVAFAQCLKETGNLKYGGDVLYTQNNFCGLGATGGIQGCTFKDIETGILAQVQHLKTYATKAALNNPCVDPRRTTWFVNTKGGTVTNVEELGGVWSVPGYDKKKYSSLESANKAKDSYGYQIIDILNKILKIDIKEETIMAYRIADDAGHGSNTAGKRTPDGYKEHYINVKCASYFDIAMRRCGVEVIKIAWDDTNATDDTDVALTTRQNQIKNAKCDISVSWHANAYGSGSTYNSAQGIETLIHSNTSRVGDSKNLATKVQAQLAKGTTQKNRGVKTSNLAMCNCTAMGTKASILIEIGFMTNQYEANLMKTDAFCLECAEEAAKGVCEYLGISYIKPNTNSVNTISTINTGDIIVLSNTPVYASATNTTASSKKSGTYYIWDSSISNGRIRITNAKNRVGVSGQITGWINISDIGITTNNTTTATTTPTSKKYVSNGIDYSLVFDPIYYANKYSDLKAAFGTNVTKLFEHFLANGMWEGRVASSNFNVTVYKERYTDLQKAFGEDLPSYYKHYVEFGKKEGRSAV